MVRHKHIKNPKITFKEQLTTKDHDLASAIKNNNLCLLPRQYLRENSNQLESLFRTSAEHITNKKLSQLAPEIINTYLKPPFTENDLLEKPPRVLSESPRVEDRTSNNFYSLLNKSLCKTTSPKIMRNTIDKQSADGYFEGTFQK